MGLHRSAIPAEVHDILERGAVIPAHPLALTAERKLDQRRQRALTRYYVDAGAGGVAVGVHTTQFEIRQAGLYEVVLETAIEAAHAWSNRPLAMIAGLVGRTDQAVREAKTAAAMGYHAGLLSLAALKGAGSEELISHCRSVAQEIPLIGFYLQTAVGGIALDANFWRRFCEIDNVLAIKVAPFNRYRTLDVVRGVVGARAEKRIALLTGNDDHILLDLALPFAVPRDGEQVVVRFRSGLLGHWSVWTKSAVAILKRIQGALASGPLPEDLLALDSRITDCNAAFFDVANGFRGCIAGCHEVLRRQGLLEGIWCLDPNEGLGPGQGDEIDRVCREHADLSDDAFVSENCARWLA